MSLDGFADGPYAIIDAEFYEFTHGLLSNTRTIAFGRNTFEQFQTRWPAILEKDNAPESIYFTMKDIILPARTLQYAKIFVLKR